MKSIKLYLVIAILSTMTLLNFLAALHGYRSSVAAANNLFDTQLRETANLLDSFSDEMASEHPSERLVFQFWTWDQARLLHTSGPSEPISDFAEGFGYKNFSGYRWRTFTLFSSERKRWTLVAERTDKRFLLAEVIALESIVPVVISLPLAGLLIWIIIRRGLSLLSRLAEDLARKKAGDLSAMQYDHTPRELTPVVLSINALFAELENALEREKRFAADAAHELRTPIAALRIHLHNLKHDLVEHRDKIDVVNGDVLRLEHLVEQILSLYQTTPAHFQARMENIDLYELAKDVIVEMYAEFEKKTQTVELSGERAELNGDANALTIMLHNLLINANKYSPVDGRIDVNVVRQHGKVVLTVSDTGPGIPESEYHRVFDRFYRVGGDRHASQVSGCGLGLSIVKHIAELHGAQIKLSSPPGHSGLVVTVVFHGQPPARQSTGEAV